MKNIVPAYFVILLLAVISVTPVQASITIQAIINEDIQVVFGFRNISSDVYADITLTDTTIPETIKNNLIQQGLTNVDYSYAPLDFNSTENSLQVSFILFGSDILSSTVDTESMTKTCRVRTDWRKFRVNLTNEILLDFTKYFGEPLENWPRTNYTLNSKTHPAYYYNFTAPDTLDPVCYFVLPIAATNFQFRGGGDIIIFELPLLFEDFLLNSPFLILCALIILIIAFHVYRKVRR